MIKEIIIELEDTGEYFDVVQEINTWGWGILEAPNEVVNLGIVRKFYVNVKPTKETPMEKVS